MQNILASLVVGGLLLVLGGSWLRWHFRVWNEHRNDATLDERERRHYRRQFRRRVQVAGLLILLGALIPIGDMLLARDVSEPRAPVGAGGGPVQQVVAGGDA